MRGQGVQRESVINALDLTFASEGREGVWQKQGATAKQRLSLKLVGMELTALTRATPWKKPKLPTNDTSCVSRMSDL